MASIKSTQTPHKFIWRFFSPSTQFPSPPWPKPYRKYLVILAQADTEEEARAVLPGCKLVFAARFPITEGLMEVRRV